MRTFILLIALMMPPIVACSVVYAKTSSTDIGKPVCTHYDDSAKPAHQAAGESVVVVAPSMVSVNGAALSTAGAGGASAPQTKGGGGTAGSMRPHGAPRWQTFLPGMFK